MLAILLASTKDTFQVGYLGFNRRLFKGKIFASAEDSFQGGHLGFSRRLSLFKEEIVASKKTSSVASAE